MEVKKAVILAAGLASRMMPATKALSKPMLPIVDKPAIHYCVEELVQSGVKEIAIVVNKHDSQVENYFSKNETLNNFAESCKKPELVELFKEIEGMAKFTFFQQEKPMGPGHALLKVKEFIGREPFLLVYSDDLVLSKTPASKQLIDCFEKTGTHIVAVSPVEKNVISHFGVIKPVGEEKNPIKVSEIVEKPAVEDAPSNLAVAGRYLLLPEVFEILEKENASMEKELYVTDKLQVFASEGKLFACKLEGKWITTGKKIDYVKAIVAFALQREDIGAELKTYLKELLK